MATPAVARINSLKDAGHSPEVIKSYGLGILPDALNQTPGRKEVQRLTGNQWVPALVTDDGTVIQGSREIEAWAKANPAQASRGSACRRRELSTHGEVMAEHVEAGGRRRSRSRTSSAGRTTARCGGRSRSPTRTR